MEWCLAGDTRDGHKAAPAENLAIHRQAAPLAVGKAQPVRPVRSAQDQVLRRISVAGFTTVGFGANRSVQTARRASAASRHRLAAA